MQNQTKHVRNFFGTYVYYDFMHIFYAFLGDWGEDWNRIFFKMKDECFYAMIMLCSIY
jgi:hypothetical protein